jgi:RHS repeat-associated protein
MQTEASFKGSGPVALVVRRAEARRAKALSMCLGFLGPLLVLAMTPASAAGAECTDTWTGPAEGPWLTAANWSAGHVPTESDVACIGLGKTVSLTTGTNKAGVVQGEGKLAISGGTLELLNSTSSSSIANLKMTGGILTGPATLGISGSLTVEKSSTMSGTGSTVVQSTASASLSNKLKLTKRRLVNEGSVTLLTSGTVEGSESPEVLNAGTFTLNGAGVSGATFVNKATIKKLGTATNGIGSTFENLGTVEVLGGVFSASKGSSSPSSQWTASEGGKFLFSSGTTATSFSLAGTLSGPVEVTNSTGTNLILEGVSGAKASVEVSDYSKLTVSGAPSTLGTLAFGREGYNQAHATLNGAGELKISSSLEAAYESTMSGSGTTTILPGAVAHVSKKTTLSQQRKLVNEGSLTLLSSGSLPTEEKGEIVNTGTITRTGTGTNGFGFLYNNGTVEIEEGKLSFSTGSSGSSSQWLTSNGAELIFSAYSLSGTLAGRASVDGASSSLTLEALSGTAGEIEVSHYGTLTISGSPSTVGTLRFGREGYNVAHGLLNGGGEVKVSGSLENKFDSRMSGTGTTKILPGASATFSDGLELTKRRIVNEGSVNLLASGSIEGIESPEILNTGTFTLNGGGVGGATFVNEGTVKKIGAASNGIGPMFTNLATVEVLGGILTFTSGSSTSSSQWAASEGGKFRFTSSTASVYSLKGTISGPVEMDRPSTSVVLEGVKGSSASFEVSDYSQLTVSGSPTAIGALVFGREGYNEGRGELTGAGELRIVNSLEAAYTHRVKGTGTTRLLPGSSANVSSTSQMSERHLINEGTFTLSGNGWLELSNKAEVVNTGTFFANTSASSAVGGSESLKSSFVNEGAVRKSVGTNTTLIAPPFINSGSIREESGHISIPNPITIPASSKTDNHSQCGDPVDCGTGNFSETQTDYEIVGRGVGLNLIRTYSAKAAAAASSPGAFGYGWVSSFSDRLAIEEEGKKATLTQSDGGTIPFTESGKGSYGAPVWSQDLLYGNAEAGYTLTLPEQTKYKFSGSGRLESVVDRNGNETTLSYDEVGRLKEITGPGGRQITLSYNGEGLVESAKDPMGNLVKYTYESKNLKTVTLPGETSPNWEFKYDASHRMTSMTDGRGGKTSNEYDSSSRVISQTEPSGQTLTFKYEAFHTTITNKANGAVTDEWFTSNNQPYSITRGFGTAGATTETFTYNVDGQLTSVTDGNGHVTTYGYDAAGNQTSEKDAAGNERKWTYNETHDVLTETTPAKETTTFKRDANGNVESISRPGPEETVQTTALSHDEDGQLESVTDSLERTWSYTYDSYGDRASETNPVGETQTFNYDKDSRLVSLVTPRGNLEGVEPSEYEATVERDGRGRPKKIIDPLGHATEYAYDVNGNLLSMTDANGHTTKYVYNAANQQIKIEKPNGATIETGYDKTGQVTSQVDANKHTTTYVRNVLEQPVEVIDPLSRKTTSEFDDAGNLVAVTDPAERKTSYTYNPANRLVEVGYSEEATPGVSFEYDADGNVTSMVDGTGESRFAYDQLGRLTESEDGHGDIVGYGYDLANGLTRLRYPNGKEVIREFDPAGRLESVTDWVGKTTTFAYDADSNIEGIVFPAASGNVDEYSYDRADQLSEARFTKGAETLATLSYGRSKVGLIEEEAKEGLPGPEEVAYGYDNNDRLVEAGEASFEYDPADNLTKGLGSTNTYDAASQLELGTGVSYTYDNNSERIKVTPSSGPATSYGYNQAGSLTSVERPEEGEVPAIDESFAYDGSGLMASRTSGLSTHSLTWDSNSSLPLLLDDGQNSYIYGPGGLAVEQISSEEAPTYLHHDQLSSTRLVTNAEGEITDTFTYGPYGALEGSTGASTTLLGFAGQYTDPETGLQYLRARFYDPSTGQFISRDPLAALTRAPFGYANSNPVNSADPTGLGPCILGIISCDESDDPCDSPITTNILMPLCLVPGDATETVTNASAGIGDSILSPVPFVELPISGPSARDFLGINNVNECSLMYTAGNLAGELISFGKGVRGIAKHTPGIWRDASRHLNEKIVHLPPEIHP